MGARFLWLPSAAVFAWSLPRPPVTAGEKPEHVLKKVPVKGTEPVAVWTTSGHDWTDIEIWLSLAVLAFGALALALQTIIIVKARDPWSPKAILRITALTLIITGSLI